jgi:hypothetical protein
MIFAAPNATYLATLQAGEAGLTPAWRIVNATGTPLADWTTTGVTEDPPTVYRVRPTAPNVTTTLQEPYHHEWATSVDDSDVPTGDANYATEELVIGLGLTAARVAKLDNLDAAVSSRTGMGAGSVLHVHTALDGETSQPIDGVAVWITTGTDPDVGIVASGVTDAQGRAAFMLDPGDYRVWEQRSGYTFDEPVEVTVS